MLDLPEDITNLISFDRQTAAVTSREGKRLEFKRDFVKADFSDYTKVMASFANALGGVIIFGVSDNPRRVEGCAALPDEADWSNRLKDDFDPEISFAIKSYQIGAATLYAVGINPATIKPVICKTNRSKTKVSGKGTRDVEVLREGTIYYRYAGQTRPINYSDLHNMLVARESQYLRAMMETLQVVQKVGLENAGIVDLSAPRSNVYLSAETAKGLHFIDKGNLVEEKGAPAYVVMGNVDLRQVQHTALPEADKNFPTEAAKMLSGIVKDVYGLPRISAQQVTQLLRHLGLDGDGEHCILEKKMNRKYVTRMGLAALEAFIKEKPAEAIQAFGSKKARDAYAANQEKQLFKDDPMAAAVSG